MLDFLGVFAFAISGGLVGVRRRFDVFGILVLALVTALGGGVVRDLLLGITPPTNLTNLPYMATSVVAGLIAFRFSGSLERVRRFILLADAAGLGAFAISATMIAIQHGHPGIEAILVGTITAIGGGMMRDVFAGLVPSVLTQDVYALPALFGCMATDLCVRLGVFNTVALWTLVALVFGVRVLALRFHWQVPKPKRLTRDEPTQ
ncbi:trimeric intracellular cation channel family protein [uncultured Propionibacterium sp.]|uniref:trimeric intracellular cation channel family protein n=1 Tax=uncultured Propionibacterium sp. TaxID=218066 RepID=UPI00292CF82C|nr:trimeric intracellular cation channel family protein [uncultured Propionibacterium sp.]